MMDKRMKKLDLALEKINQDDMAICHDLIQMVKMLLLAGVPQKVQS